MRRNGEARLARTEKILIDAGYGPVLVPTTGPRTAAALARQAIDDGADLILAAGGDGTVNEVIEGMLHSRVPLGVLPAGTANVLATEMRLGSRMEKVAAHLGESTPHRISVGRIEFDGGAGTRHFLLMAGFGLDAHVVYRVSQPLKARWGKIAYWIAGFGLVGRQLAEFDVTLEGRRHRCSFALVSKVRNYGGDLEIARHTSLFDNQFELVLFEGRSSYRYLKYLAAVAVKRTQGVRGVTICRATEICVSAAGDSRVYIQIDGEFAGRLPAKVTLVQDALTLLVPPDYERKFKPSMT